MELKRLSRQLVSESAIYGVSGVLTKFVAVFVIPVYTRVFSPEVYGQMSVVNSTYLLLTTIAVLGLDGASSRWYWSVDSEEERSRVMSTWFFTQTAISIVMAAVVITLAKPLSSLFFGTEDASFQLVLSAASMPVAAFSVVLAKFLRFKRKPVSSVVFSLATNLFNVGAAIVLVLRFKMGIAGFFLAALLSKTLGMVWAMVVLKGRLMPRFFSPGLLRRMLGYSLPMMPTIVGSWLINQVSVYFLNFTKGTGEAALFQVAGSMAAFGSLFFTAFQQAWGPFAFSIEKQEGARRFYGLALFIYSCLGSMVAMLNGLFGKELLGLLTAKGYGGSSTTIVILSFTFILQGFLSIAALGCNIAKRNGPIGAGVMIGAAVSIALNAILDPLLGRDGAAIAFMASQLAYSAFVFWKSQGVYPIPYPFAASYAVFFILLGVSLAGVHWARLPARLAMTACLAAVALFSYGRIKAAIKATLVKA